MTERLHHEFNETGVSLTIPSKALALLGARDSAILSRLWGIPKRDRVFDFVESGTDGYRLTLDYEKLGHMEDPIKRGNAIHMAIAAYDLFGSYPARDMEDTRLVASLSDARRDARYAMEAWARPADGATFDELSVHATHAMRWGAEALRHCSDEELAHVGAHFHPEQGYVFATGSIAGSMLSTTGSIWEDSRGRIEVTAGNFFSDTDQFVALAGLVAFVEGRSPERAT